MIRSESLFETPSVYRFFLRWYRPRVLENFTESVDGNSLLQNIFFSRGNRGALTGMQSNPGNHECVFHAGVIKIMEV